MGGGAPRAGREGGSQIGCGVEVGGRACDSSAKRGMMVREEDVGRGGRRAEGLLTLKPE